MKRIAIVVGVVVVLAGLIAYVAKPGGNRELGQGVPEGAVVTTVGELAANPGSFDGKEVTVTGKLVQVCPTSGCWGVVDDGTGTVRWDSAPSGWALPPGQSGKEITVHGRVSVNEAGAPQITALGARL